ncbi:MAG: (d)CMP kinase [Bacillota bacterium]|nr:(d)CMP kinase [Bacillota bacterium]
MISIAIDGPSGAGKSTISKLSAKELNFIYVDTGALYRAIGYAAMQKKISCDEIEKVTELLNSISVRLVFNEKGEQRVMLSDEDVSDYIRTPEVSMMASAISALPIVREYLLDLQRNLAKTNNVIMDGRDIGTVVLPNAQIKIFLFASPEDRAKRRYDELCEKGMQVNYDDVLQDIITRDYNDSHRETAPLKPAENAIMVETTGNTLEQSVQKLLSIMKENIEKLK